MPVHAVLQQTPLAQWPLLHSGSAPQATLFAFLGRHVAFAEQ
jgi:hypothetical protein